MTGYFKLARAKNGGDDPSHYSSPVAEGTVAIIVKAQPGRVYGGSVEILTATQYWLMIFDKATIPVNGDTPKYRKRLLVSGSTDLSLYLAEFGLGLPTGIGIAISSTSGVLTIAVAADALFHLAYK